MSLSDGVRRLWGAGADHRRVARASVAPFCRSTQIITAPNVRHSPGVCTPKRRPTIRSTKVASVRGWLWTG